MTNTNKYSICGTCKGKGEITMIHETQMQAGGQIFTLSSEKGETRPCDTCGGSGFIPDNQ